MEASIGKGWLELAQLASKDASRPALGCLFLEPLLGTATVTNGHHVTFLELDCGPVEECEAGGVSIGLGDVKALKAFAKSGPLLMTAFTAWTSVTAPGSVVFEAGGGTLAVRGLDSVYPDVRKVVAEMADPIAHVALQVKYLEQLATVYRRTVGRSRREFFVQVGIHPGDGTAKLTAQGDVRIETVLMGGRGNAKTGTPTNWVRGRIQAVELYHALQDDGVAVEEVNRALEVAAMLGATPKELTRR